MYQYVLGCTNLPDPVQVYRIQSSRCPDMPRCQCAGTWILARARFLPGGRRPVGPPTRFKFAQHDARLLNLKGASATALAVAPAMLLENRVGPGPAVRVSD
jgi:hypothetical protein